MPSGQVDQGQGGSARTDGVRAIVFDVGETLVDESAMWTSAATASGIPVFTLMGVIGGLAARGESHTRVWELLGVDRPAAPSVWREGFYPDALPCLARLRRLGFTTGAVGNTPIEAEEMLRPFVDFVGSSERWGIQKPSHEFFERVAREAGVEPAGIAYVGDRVDNDVAPALEAGMVAIHIRRGPWGYLQQPPPAALSIRSLDELPGRLHQDGAGTAR